MNCHVINCYHDENIKKKKLYNDFFKIIFCFTNILMQVFT